MLPVVKLSTFAGVGQRISELSPETGLEPIAGMVEFAGALESQSLPVISVSPNPGGNIMPVSGTELPAPGNGGDLPPLEAEIDDSAESSTTMLDLSIVLGQRPGASGASGPAVTAEFEGYADASANTQAAMAAAPDHAGLTRADSSGLRPAIPLAVHLAGSPKADPLAQTPTNRPSQAAPNDSLLGSLAGAQSVGPLEQIPAADATSQADSVHLRPAPDLAGELPTALQADRAELKVADLRVAWEQQIQSARQAMPESLVTPADAARTVVPAANHFTDLGQGQAARQPIDIPVGDSNWDLAIANRVLLVASNKLQSAEIRLSPADLGPLRIDLSIDDNKANVSFQAHQAVTREAIEQALPRLRDLLSESGLQLGRCDVGDPGDSRQGTGEQLAGERRSAAAASGSATEPAEPDSGSDSPLASGRTVVGLLDTFA